jgi:hypothetical protein
MSLEEARSWQVEVLNSAVAKGAGSNFKLGCLRTAVCKCLHPLSRLMHLPVGGASKAQRCRRNR